MSTENSNTKQPCTIDSVIHCNSNNEQTLSDDDIEIKEHGCPFKEEIYGDYDFQCDCDEDATQQCAMDI